MNTQRGFGAVGLVVILVLLAVIGGGGYYVATQQAGELGVENNSDGVVVEEETNIGETSTGTAGTVSPEIEVQVQEQNMVRVIVMLRTNPPFRPLGELSESEQEAYLRVIQDTQSELIADLNRFDAEVIVRYTSIPAIALEVSPAVLQFLSSHHLVASVQEDIATSPLGS